MGRVETNCSSQQPESEAHQRCISKIKKGRCKFGDLQLRNEVKDSVCEDVNGRPTGHDVASPPPIIVLVRNERIVKVSACLETKM